MRKLLLLIAFLPLIAAIGHDAYNYYQNPEKGFHLADIGWIWAKYDPQSHQQIREELNTLIEESESSRTPVMTAEPIEEEPETATLPPAEDGAPSPETEKTPEALDDGTAMIRVKVQKNTSALPDTNEIVGNAAGFVSFLMKQKAVVVAACFAALMLILMRLFGGISFGGKKEMDEIDMLAGKKKGGQFKYSRK
ncbi:MAG: hypothetical protein KDI90_05260 [Alphaproteobacteria bacterium]|nr:hypothetical protein [Alphaproteobacteria bacterium]MCB9975373.1 hypothetical protein [Rhodospirillales bacterium]